MGIDTAESLEASTEDEPIVEIEPTESEKPADASEVSDEDEEQQEAVEVEVVRQGDDGSQPDKQHGIRKRINKLNDKVAHANELTSQAETDLVLEREKNKVLALALDQAKTTKVLTPPDPADFDDGVRDPKYIAKLNEYNQPMIAAEVQKQTANLSAPEPVNPDLERKQTKHYERAESLKAKDFDETEDEAIAILGKDFANHLIQNSDKSEMVLYYLGKNPTQAEEIKHLIATNPIKGMLQIGRLEAELSIQPRANSEPTPDPDEELSGGSPSAGKTNKHQRNVDAARVRAQENGDMGPVLAAKKAAREAGVTVS